MPRPITWAQSFSNGGKSGGWRPLGIFLQKLSAAETHYSAFNRELLAVHSSIQHFRHWLEGRHFTVYTDHKPVVGALAHVSEPKSDHKRRQLSAIAELTSDIWHIPGDAKTVADTLSRHARTASHSNPGPTSPAAKESTLLAATSEHSPQESTVETEVQRPAVAAFSNTNPGPFSPPPIHISEIAAAQTDCPDCHRAPLSHP
jgi:hypothetical protein